MKVPLSWLQEYININLSPEKLSHALTMAGLEVDLWEKTSLPFEGVVVGKVISKKPHPDAEKLCKAIVTDGSEEYQVVCGAPNCREGLITAFAKIGAKIQEPDGKSFKIKKSKLRGIESYGMLCSGKELQLSEEYEGILDFPETMPIGSDLADYYSDIVFEISLTPNLSYCASIIGVARDLSATLEIPFTVPEVQITENEDDPIENNITVEVHNTTSCPRYCCSMLKDVTIQPSPQWLQQRLVAAGIRPINNVVDVTNYVLLEYGHPLHAFDYNKIADKKIIVKDASKDETFTTLDGQERKLNTNDLMICDGEKSIALAGVMGGANTEMSDNSTNVLLEAAYFHPSTVRKTSKKLNLQTDSSWIFERGSDVNNVPKALKRATQLIHELAGGTIVKGIVDTAKEPFEDQIIHCRPDRINLVLGTQLSRNEIETIFKRLGFSCDHEMNITVPTYRVDISAEIDLIEEVARVYGYDNIPKKSPRYTTCNLDISPIYTFGQDIRNNLINEGLQEFITCDLISPKMADLISGSLATTEKLLKIQNPTSVEQSVLRPSLLSTMLHIVKHNQDHSNHDVMGFEVGRIYFQGEDSHKEQPVVAIVLSGKRHPHHWQEKNSDLDFFDLKGIAENLLVGLGISKPSFVGSQFENFHPGRQASIMVNGINLGIIGEVHPSTTKTVDVDGRVFFAELNLCDLLEVRRSEPIITELPIFPASERDWTITLENSVSSQEVLNVIENTKTKFLEQTSIKDIYQSDKIEKEYRNITFNFVYRNNKKTISLKEVEKEHNQITDNVLQKFKNNIKLKV
jgi:phenylalanyl-tRNA synthetase beta chain